MRSRISIAALVVLQCVLVAVTPCSLHAQDRWPLGPGSRVRVTHTDPCCRSPQVGELVSVSGDSVVLLVGRAGTRAAVSRAAVWSVERGHPGGSYAPHGAMLGLLLGTGAGAALGAATTECRGQTDCLVALQAIVYGAYGLVVGGAVGAIVGAQRRRERWRPVLLPASVGVGPGVGGGFAVRLTLRR